MCVACEMNLEQMESFAQRMMQIINEGSLGLMISLGHRTGLFECMKTMEWATSMEMAKAANLNERYVREWLGAMAVGRIVTVDNTGKLFNLPKEHVPFLTREGGNNIAVYAQYLSVMGGVEDRLVQCFETGEGIAYEAYDRFHEVMAEDSEQTVLSSLVEDIIPLVPNGLEKLEEGISVFDVGCGSGKALLMLAEHFPNSNFEGLDLCGPPIKSAQEIAMQKELKNAIFEQADLTNFEFERKYDLIMAFDAIHDQARPDMVLNSIYGALETNGIFLMQDIDASENVYNNLDLPLGSMLYAASCMHCMPVSLGQNGMGLGAMWGTERAGRMLTEAGFTSVKEHRLDHDVQNCYFVAHK